MAVQNTNTIANLLKLPQTPHQFVSNMCVGCKARAYKGGYRQCPLYNLACLYCHKLGKFCQGKQGSQKTTSGAISSHVSTNTILSSTTRWKCTQPSPFVQDKWQWDRSSSNDNGKDSTSTETKNVDALPLRFRCRYFGSRALVFETPIPPEGQFTVLHYHPLKIVCW